MSIESVVPSNYLTLCHPTLLLPSTFPSIRVFSSESPLRIRWPTFRSFSFSISSSNEYSGLISFRMDWLDLLAAQGTLKNLLQQHSSKASILQCSWTPHLSQDSPGRTELLNYISCFQTMFRFVLFFSFKSKQHIPSNSNQHLATQ